MSSKTGILWEIKMAWCLSNIFITFRAHLVYTSVTILSWFSSYLLSIQIFRFSKISLNISKSLEFIQPTKRRRGRKKLENLYATKVMDGIGSAGPQNIHWAPPFHAWVMHAWVKYIYMHVLVHDHLHGHAFKDRVMIAQVRHH